MKDEAILRNMSYKNVEDIYNYIGSFCKEMENPELLADAAESLRLAIETRNPDLIKKAKKQIIMFYLQDRGSEATDSMFDVVRTDDNIDTLFDD